MHAPAFLVDEDQKLVRADGLAHGTDERADLLVALQVAGKEDQPRWPRLLQEGGFARREREARDAGDQSGAHCPSAGQIERGMKGQIIGVPKRAPE